MKFNKHYAITLTNFKNFDAFNLVEWGKWQINAEKSLIAVQVTNVDGYSILSAMLGRWEIRKLTEKQLVLKPYGFADQYLVFERGS